jgi:hypothetical protein
MGVVRAGPVWSGRHRATTSSVADGQPLLYHALTAKEITAKLPWQPRFQRGFARTRA